mmetsp:Transcript_44181/g.99590  ORF Transcript_44181/g.99590 Transcript_44181/m.99590 type:complete len:300 (+) Transcript_44181:68-967(+)
MGKDFFGIDRYHCTVHGCGCTDFYSEAQKDMDEAEAADQDDEGDNSIQVLHGKYHNMTCQAKSMYQLTCVKCDHNVNVHSTKPRDDAWEWGEACTLYVLQEVCFKKGGADPEKAGVVKLKRSTGHALKVTAARWRGPSGGLWAELEVSGDQKPGWVLIEGPGFGIEGPVLGDQPPLAESAPDAIEPQFPALEPPPAKEEPSPFTLERAQGVMREISRACRQQDFLEQAADPLLVGQLFIDKCAGEACKFGFGTGEDGVRKMFAEIRWYIMDHDVRTEVESIEQSLGLGPGGVLALAESS